MVDLSKKYISEVIYVVSYERDVHVRLRQADAEQVFKTLFPVQSIQVNMPDEFDPQVPRIVFQAPRRQLTISQIAAQITLHFERQGGALGEKVEGISRSIKEFHDCLLRFKEKQTIRENAVVVSMNYPTDLSQDEMHEYLYRRFFKIRPLAKLASLNFKLGFRTTDDFFLNLETNVYELRIKEFTPPMPTPSVIEISEISLVEKGYGVKIDVNNKPMRMGGRKYVDIGPERTITKVTNLVLGEADKFMGFTR
ncbi:MAG: hypothetical protein HY323_15355 [Betaproteobacteria bacterium]|nr:hypothetical protein [Betaproteobacteria bacterium]